MDIKMVRVTRSLTVAERRRDASWYWIFRSVTQDHSKSFELTPFLLLFHWNYWCMSYRFWDIHHLTRSRLFRRSLDHAKRSFYRAANSIFSKTGRIASEEIILQLVKSKCIPVLLYGLEACELTKAQIASLDFVSNRFFTARCVCITRTMPWQDVCPSVRPSVCLSVTRRYCA